MSQLLPYDEINFDKNLKSEDTLNTEDVSEIGYFVECDLKYPDQIKEKNGLFLFAPERKVSPQNRLSD